MVAEHLRRVPSSRKLEWTSRVVAVKGLTQKIASYRRATRIIAEATGTALWFLQYESTYQVLSLSNELNARERTGTIVGSIKLDDAMRFTATTVLCTQWDNSGRYAQAFSSWRLRMPNSASNEL